jgi:hypothetical protein
MARRAIVFLFLTLIFSTTLIVLARPRQGLAFDCLTLTLLLGKATKHFANKSSPIIEAELQDLLAKQAEQRKQTGTLKGDVDFLNSQIKALMTRLKRAPWLSHS